MKTKVSASVSVGSACNAMRFLYFSSIISPSHHPCCCPEHRQLQWLHSSLAAASLPSLHSTSAFAEPHCSFPFRLIELRAASCELRAVCCRIRTGKPPLPTSPSNYQAHSLQPKTLLTAAATLALA